ncbi:hypothetical protein [Deinococcus multiflagellatus]|uniref:Uncharacterized protein n=1 Tax=Deinococcus multiflagellatus TaxID=1656887 RepID=A0ABW1ZSB8_9DEIO|nr:hypothetical protein [Deinococcus multiflagellatus]MBZ9714933.1 hypothetical protein [Deinococcus multiflagellatus]
MRAFLAGLAAWTLRSNDGENVGGDGLGVRGAQGRATGQEMGQALVDERLHGQALNLGLGLTPLGHLGWQRLEIVADSAVD